MRFLATALTLVAVSLLAVAAHSAQPAVSYMVSPIDLEVAVAPGNAAIAALTVRNNSARTTAFSAKVERSAGAWAAAPFLKVDPAEFSIQPGRTIALRVSAAVPKGVEGSRYAYLVISPLPLPALNGNYVVGITPQIAARVAVRVKGTERVQAGLQSIAARRVNGGIEVRLVFSNKASNTHVRLSGELTVADESGKELRRVPVSKGPVFIYPGSLWERTLALDDLPRGPFVVRAVLDYGASSLSVGTVTLR